MQFFNSDVVLKGFPLFIAKEIALAIIPALGSSAFSEKID